MKRTEVFHTFKKYKQEKDARSMDEICSNPGGEFQLQVQQKFLKEYIQKHPSWKKLLLYHQIGSGKTCTSITIAEEYMRMNPGSKVTIVLPARLRTNYFDELISPCGMDKYVSKKDFDDFFNGNTSAKKKQEIKTRFMNAIAKKYEIMSFERFKINAMKAPNLDVWAKNFTQNRLVVVDEVHNLLSDTYDDKKYKEIMATGMYTRAKGSNTILFKYLAANMHASGKMVLLTATPIFNNITQFKELLYVMEPDASYDVRKAKIGDVIGLLKGKVSFFPGTSPNAYPSVSEKIHEIPLSNMQDIQTKKVIMANQDIDNPDKEAFMGLQRQISLATLPGKQAVSKNINKVIANMKEYCPKIVELLKLIDANVGKHVVYSSFIQSGIKVIKAALEAKGWRDFNDVKNDKDLWNKHQYKVFAIWDGSVKDADKTVIKNVVNKVDNIDGKMVRVLIGSPSMREGISFKHVQHMHIMDPVWNVSAKAQVEGRAIRFCSHVDIPRDHPTLKRSVVVHLYKIVPRFSGQVNMTCDQEIYERIIPSKQMVVKSGETALKKVAIDYFLFRNMYHPERMPSPPPVATGLRRSDSIVSLNEEDNIMFHKRSITRKVKTCPKKRRPDNNGNCPPGEFKKLNPHGEMCCYKNRPAKNVDEKKKERSKEPKQRQPRKTATTSDAVAKKGCAKGRSTDEAGNCATGFYAKENKQGVVCCFKKYERKKK